MKYIVITYKLLTIVHMTMNKELLLLENFIDEIFNEQKIPSTAAFFLGSDADLKTKQRIKKKGYRVVEGTYDNLVYHPLHWKVISFEKAKKFLNDAKNYQNTVC